jgi:hypothetical protein
LKPYIAVLVGIAFVFILHAGGTCAQEAVPQGARAVCSVRAWIKGADERVDPIRRLREREQG